MTFIYFRLLDIAFFGPFFLSKHPPLSANIELVMFIEKEDICFLIGCWDLPCNLTEAIVWSVFAVRAVGWLTPLSESRNIFDEEFPLFGFP